MIKIVSTTKPQTKKYAEEHPPCVSGKLSFREFMFSVIVIHRGTKEERLDMAFKLYDINGDKKITKDEMTQINEASLSLLMSTSKYTEYQTKLSQNPIVLLSENP